MTILKPVPILMYHEITSAGSPEEVHYKKTFGPYFLREDAFRAQMACLKRNGFRTISLYQLMDYLKGASPAGDPGKLIILTFDDGYAGNHRFALPILKEFGFTATVFVVAGSVGKQNMMDWQQLREMAGAGISIQSHTLTHRFMKQLEDNEISRELSESKSLLESKLGVKVDFLSLPHGSYGATYKKLASQAGYSGGCSSSAGLNRADTDQFLLKRINVSAGLTIGDFEKIINGDHFLMNKIILSKFIKECVKYCIGERIYKQIYNTIFRMNSTKQEN